MQLATALAQVSDPDFLEAVLHIKSMLDRLGGQMYLAGYREKFDGEGRLLSDHKQPGNYETVGYLFHYDHIAKITQAPNEPDANLKQPMTLEVVEDADDSPDDAAA